MSQLLHVSAVAQMVTHDQKDPTSFSKFVSSPDIFLSY